MSYRDRDRREYSSRDRRDDRRPGGSSSRRSPSPPPKPRDDKELPESFGRETAREKDDDSNVLQRMSKKFRDAPLGSLTKCLEGNRKIKVWTRNFREVRGICTGYVIAFDKHWNLVMSDVDEVYLKRKKHKTPFFDSIQSAEDFPEITKKTAKEKKATKSVETQENEPSADPVQTVIDIDAPAEGGATKKKKKRRKKKNSSPYKRHLKQLFVRGDSVVMAAILESEDEAPE